jgi:hypothetical protein
MFFDSGTKPAPPCVEFDIPISSEEAAILNSPLTVIKYRSFRATRRVGQRADSPFLREARIVVQGGEIKPLDWPVDWPIAAKKGE